MKILVLAAMSRERALLERAFGAAGRHEIVIAETGIGKVNAAVGAVRAIGQTRPDAVVSSGVAGGLVAGLRPGDVVAAASVAYHDVWCGAPNARGQVQGMPRSFAADPRLLEVARAVAERSRRGGGSRIAIGAMASGDEFVQSAERRDAVLAVVPDAVAADMESGALAQTCFILGVPFISFRVLSDTPGAAADHAAQYEDFWAAMAGKSFGAVRDFLEALPAGLAPVAPERGCKKSEIAR
ncbi:MAG: 5'-methylthioadenosine/S-adenosylhomocysteine nucleosidase [Kiritimatiellae bacterium]|nr:5'-methylthioadenosine/S-adenosylhomocysteine nucleosidase [Kiritimatiellia bacterium]